MSTTRKPPNRSTIDENRVTSHSISPVKNCSGTSSIMMIWYIMLCSGIELPIGVRVMRIGVAPENAVAVKLDLPPAHSEVFGRAEFRVIDLDLVGEEIKTQPDKEVGNQHKANPVVGHHRRAEGNHLHQVQVPDLQPGGNHQDEAEALVQCQILTGSG